jgi:hypothetical protein
MTSDETIAIDVDAAGWGWFVDVTPWEDSEFTTPGNQGEQGRIDLLTALMHELGHSLGLHHVEEGVMAEQLAAGIRHTDYYADHFDGNDAALQQYLSSGRLWVKTMDSTLTAAPASQTQPVQAWQNQALHEDVDGDGHVAPSDALAIINYLNSKLPTGVQAEAESGAPFGLLDVDGDGHVAPGDALTVINFLNSRPKTAAEGEAPVTDRNAAPALRAIDEIYSAMDFATDGTSPSRRRTLPR